MRQIVEAWDGVNGGHGIEALQARIVRAVRVWRPAAIVTCDVRGESDDPLAGLVHQAVTQAVRQAADAAAFPEQIAEAGLKPWQVRQAFAAMPPGSRGSNDLSTAQFMPGLAACWPKRSPSRAGCCRIAFTLAADAGVSVAGWRRRGGRRRNGTTCLAGSA